MISPRSDGAIRKLIFGTAESAVKGIPLHPRQVQPKPLAPVVPGFLQLESRGAEQALDHRQGVFVAILGVDAFAGWPTLRMTPNLGRPTLRGFRRGGAARMVVVL
jgi:hypothetical protein